ncbi:MAG: hypothetical protein ACTSU7_13110 [Candidatus Heimdallarchaeaceae archaeon]
MHKAFGYRLTHDDIILMQKIITVATEEEIEVLDILSFVPSSTAADHLYLFGPKAISQCGMLPCINSIYLPAVSFLVDTPENLVNRSNTYNRMLELKNNKQEIQNNTPIKIKKKDIPKNDNYQALVDDLTKQGINEWILTTAENKTIKVYITPPKNVVGVLTFRMLSQIQNLFNQYGFLEVSIEPSNIISGKGSTEEKS